MRFIIVKLVKFDNAKLDRLSKNTKYSVLINVKILNKMDKIFILEELRKYKKFKTQTDFAAFLNITPQSISKWYKRNTFNIDILSNFFPEVNTDWLLTGKGEMLKKNNETVAVSNVNGDNIGCGHDNTINNSDTIHELLNQLRVKDNQISKSQEQISKQQDQISKSQEQISKSQEQIDRLISLLERK